uniref:DENN domain containing 6B n=1 Tax=Rousettus aegyptiacus TaxID=9407 RepID=A0A7J8JCW5_ROUAE|nr:DENN domain containing 6B [Rousettus aegyptiacus]
MDALSRAGPRRARDHLGAQCTGARAPAVPWARFSAWLECVCVVTFDLELGQALELWHLLPSIAPARILGVTLDSSPSTLHPILGRG